MESEYWLKENKTKHILKVDSGFEFSILASKMSRYSSSSLSPSPFPVPSPSPLMHFQIIFIATNVYGVEQIS